ncbi:deoxynucleotide monophosphate kinase family protein [Shewanella sp. SE1]|uniref:deoxynucleotide monophosphate kinase family protein n=1 Tax=Shewanella sp. SE1 TaxID=2705014 RepID=UPI00138F4FFA|nr:hypothetical protein [Shewanella sp. SE1]NDO73060.1 hypothetical protein [Shewanella sp. SE1]
MIIGLSGRAGSGKSTAAQILERTLPNNTIVPVAQPLKQIVHILYPRIPVELLEPQTPEQRIEREERNFPEYSNRTTRRILLDNADKMRKQYGEQIFTELLYENIELAQSQSEYIIVPDIRYDSEANVIKQQGGIILHVNSHDSYTEIYHTSEAGISVNYVDRMIHNVSTLDDLEREVLRALSCCTVTV